MTFWSYYALGIIALYLAAFFIRNLKTYFALGKSIRGKSIKLTLSVTLSTLIYAVSIAQIFSSSQAGYLVTLDFLDFELLRYMGYATMLVALSIGLAALFEMRNSWRVGIKYDQKTDLVTTGIYAFSRNPYFLSYDLLFLGLCFIYPSLVLLLSTFTLAIIFHFMIVEEEAYLESVHDKKYLDYKKQVGRYITF